MGGILRRRRAASSGVTTRKMIAGAARACLNPASRGNHVAEKFLPAGS
jgi:hypothetical protein